MSDVTTLTVAGGAGTKVSVTAVSGNVKEVYYIDADHPPQEDMLLVQESRKQLLQTINMQKMFDNLGSCVDLLNITYNSVNGMDGGISKSVAAIQSDFLNVLTDSIVVMQGFETGTSTVVLSLIKAYTFLTKPMYTKLPLNKNGVIMACNIFEQIQTKAIKMRKESEGIAKRYAELRNKTSTTNGSIMDVRDKDYDLRQKKQLELTQFQAQIEGYQEVKDDLDSEINEYTTQYNQLAGKIDKKEQQEYTLALTSAILGGVSGMVGAIIPLVGNAVESSKGSGKSTSSGTGSTPPSTNPVSEKQADSEKKVKELTEDLNTTNKELLTVKAELEALDGSDKEKKDELLKKQDELELAKKEKESLLESESSKLDVYKQAAGAVSAGLQVTSDKLDKISEKAGSSIDSMYQRLDNIATQKAKLAKERRETILKMVTLTKSLENASTEHHDLEIALNALIAAVGCMRLVEVYLADITLFWKNVESFCERLIEQIHEINEETANFKDIEDYTIFFYDTDFIRLYLINILNWTALHSISTDYLSAFNNTFKKHQSVMGQLEKSREQHWKIAQQLASGISDVFEKQLEE